MPELFLDVTKASHVDRLWARRERIRTRWVRSFTTQVKKGFRAEEDRVIAAIRSSDDPLSAAERAIDAGHKGWVRVFRAGWVSMAEDMAPTVLTTISPKSGPAYGLKATGRKADDDLWMSLLLEYIDEVTPTKIRGMTAYTKRRALDQITRGLDAGESTLDIVGRINSLYGDSITPHRSMRIARTEATAASNTATHQVARGLADTYDLEVIKKWITARDDRVRKEPGGPNHLQMEGKEAPLDEPFIVDGYEMMHPGDGSLGADASELVNCRCDTAQRVP